jgi:hypothetical protein
MLFRVFFEEPPKYRRDFGARGGGLRFEQTSGHSPRERAAGPNASEFASNAVVWVSNVANTSDMPPSAMISKNERNDLNNLLFIAYNPPCTMKSRSGRGECKQSPRVALCAVSGKFLVSKSVPFDIGPKVFALPVPGSFGIAENAKTMNIL